MSRTRYRIFDTRFPYFLTCSVVDWLPVFTRPSAVQIVLDSWRFLQHRDELTVFGYVILENHLHLVAAGENLANSIGRFKSYTARQIIDGLRERGEATMLRQLRDARLDHRTDREFQLWQEGSHPKQIQNEEMMIQKLEYTHNNPVRRGYVDRPEDWRYSSARNYARLPGLIDVTTDWR